MTAGDFNKDGKLDLATANIPASIAILRGDGAGGFAPAVIISSGNDGTYTPAAGDFNRDGKLDLITTNISSRSVSLFTNTCVENSAPVAVDDAYTARQNTTINIPAPGVQANDSDPDSSDTVTAVLISPPPVGTLALNPNGSFVYTPPLTFRGVASFTYKLSDGRAESNQATVSMIINNPPVGIPDSATLPEDSGPFPIQVLLNDGADPDEIISIIAVTQGANGAVAITDNGNALTYRPNPNFFGTDSFTYTTRDSTGGLTTTTGVSVRVTEVNDPPNALDDYREFEINAPATTIDVLANDNTLPETGETLRITSVTQGTRGGAVVITGDGARLTYRPPANFTGGDAFTYTITDGRGGSATGAVIVDIPDKVTVTNNTDTDDGVCDADCSLREAVNLANQDVSRTIIEFAPIVRGEIILRGIANPQEDARLWVALDLKSRIDLRGPGAEQLKLETVNVDEEEGPLNLLRITNGTTRISGLTLSGAYFDGIKITADAEIRDSIISRHKRIGIIISENSKVNIVRSTVKENSGSSSGGISVDYAELNLFDSTVSGNYTSESKFGAGITLNYSTAFINNSAIINNLCGYRDCAGGIFMYYSNVKINNTTISGNTNEKPKESGGGGGIVTANTALTITNSTITHNIFYSGVGGIAEFRTNIDNPRPQPILISNSIIAANQSDGYANDVYLPYGSVSGGHNLIGDIGGGSALAFTDPTDQVGGGALPVIDPLLGPLANNGGPTLTRASRGKSGDRQGRRGRRFVYVPAQKFRSRSVIDAAARDDRSARIFAAFR